MESSRIIVKGLPPRMGDAELRRHFAEFGDVTDARVMKTKTGKSRQFGFVGFREPAEAQTAVAKTHRSFAGTFRLQVEIALPLARPWSAHSKGSSRFAERHGEPSGAAEAGEEAGGEPAADSGQAPGPPGPPGSKKRAAELEEFIAANSRTGKRHWGDDGMAAAGAVSSGSESGSGSGSGSESDGDDSSTADEKPAAKKQMTDLDWLRAKMTADLGSDAEDDEEAAASDDDGVVTFRRRADSSDDESEPEQDPEPEPEQDPEHPDAEPDQDQQSTRMLLKNLPFSASEDDLDPLVSPFGDVTELHLPLDAAGKSRGYAFVSFATAEETARAIEALHEQVFQGRIVRAAAAKPKPAPAEPTVRADGRPLTFKEQQALQRQRAAGRAVAGQQAQFLRPDTVVDSLAARLGVGRGDILDRDAAGGMAVRLAVGETHLVAENRRFFEEHGVNAEALARADAASSNSAAGKGKEKKQRAKHSKTVLLIKNLPFDTEERELRELCQPCGTLARLLLPPSKTVAIVEFAHPPEARAALRKLAFKRFKHVPLYVNWAPRDVLSAAAPAAAAAALAAPAAVAVQPKADDVHDHATDDGAVEQPTTLFVKNLAFATADAALHRLFQSKVGDVRRAVVARKSTRGVAQSQGYGFVEFKNPEAAQRALDQLQAVPLDGHALQLKRSRSRARTADGGAAADGAGAGAGAGAQTKVMVRNIAFEATVDELRQLFGSFGQIKRLRLPKKPDGGHRGFAFVDFLTPQEAQSAYTALASTHLYGRHLVIEWAEADQGVEQMREAAAVAVKRAVAESVAVGGVVPQGKKVRF